METSLYTLGSVSRTVWNTKDNRYSNFGLFYEKHLQTLAIFRGVSTFLDFGHFCKFLDFALFSFCFLKCRNLSIIYTAQGLAM